MLVVCFIGGMILMPGAHKQFALQYLELVPLLFLMGGSQPLLLFPFYHYMFPAPMVEQQDNPQFLLLMGIIGQMETIGSINL